MFNSITLVLLGIVIIANQKGIILVFHAEPESVDLYGMHAIRLIFLPAGFEKGLD